MFAVVLGAVLALNTLSCASPAPPKELTAVEVLDKAATKMKSVDTVHFQLDMAGGKMQIGPGITVSKLEGDAAKPDKMSLKTKATIAGFAVEVELVTAGGKQYLKNPLTKQWEALQADLGAANLLNPEKGALAILSQAKEIKRAANEDLDGAKVFHIVATVASSGITSVTGGIPSGDDVIIDAWIGVDDFALRKVRVTGGVVQGEGPETVRTIVFSQFNQPVKIDLPQ